MRKNFDTSKSGVYALGFIKKDTYLTELCRLVGANITLKDFERNIRDSYDNEKEINYYYDPSGNLAEGAFDERKTCRYAIETGYYKRNDNSKYKDEMIFAAFIKDSYGSWNGVKFFTKYQMKNFFNAYRLGGISFKNFNDANSFIINLEKELLPGEKWMFKKSSMEDYRKKPNSIYFKVFAAYIRKTFVRFFRS